MRKILCGLIVLVMSIPCFAGTKHVWGGYLRYATSVTIPVGPFEDDAGDGVLVAVTTNDMNATFIKANGSSDEDLDLSNGNTLTLITETTDPDLWYTFIILAANTDILGRMSITFWDDGNNVIEPVTYDFVVVSTKTFNLHNSGTVDVDTILTEAPLSNAIGVKVSTMAAPALTEIAGAIWNALTASYTASGSFGELMGVPGPTLAQITGGDFSGATFPNVTLADASLTSGKYDGSTAYPLAAASSTLATAAELAKVPKSDGSASWNATALAAITTAAGDAANITSIVNGILDADLALHTTAQTPGGVLAGLPYYAYQGPYYGRYATEKTGSTSTTTVIYVEHTTSNDNDFRAGATVMVEDVTNRAQMGIIESYDTATDTITLSTALYAAPANGALVYPCPTLPTLDLVVENGLTFKQIYRILSSVLVGTSSYSGGVVTFTGLDGATSRATVTISGNSRTSVTGLNGD